MENEDPKAATEQLAGDHPVTQENLWESASGLPCLLSVTLPVPGFKVRDLLELEIEKVIDTRRNTNNPVPVWVNSVRIGEADFDVFETHRAIRISELG